MMSENHSHRLEKAVENFNLKTFPIECLAKLLHGQDFAKMIGIDSTKKDFKLA